MGSLVPSENSLDWIFYLALRASSISEFMADAKMIHSPSERIAMLDDYVDRLDAELKKIAVFERELPLCMRLLGDTIAIVKKELSECKKLDSMPVLEEFMPLKNEKIENIKGSKEEEVNSRDKKNWMSSVRLGNSDNQHLTNRQTFKLDNLGGLKEEINEPIIKDLFPGGAKRTVGTGFLPYKECAHLPVAKVKREEREIDSRDFSSKSISSRSGSNFATNDHSKLRVGQQSLQVSRKQRRCWSPELHSRFVDALKQLGGAQAATPKQIRDLMQVDDLSNDEVKSHLQKYRIHTRRVASTMNASLNHPVLGGLWITQDKSSKQRDSRCGSAQLAGCSRATSSTEDDDSDVEDDEKSDTRGWKYQIQLSMRENA